MQTPYLTTGRLDQSSRLHSIIGQKDDCAPQPLPLRWSSQPCFEPEPNRAPSTIHPDSFFADQCAGVCLQWHQHRVITVADQPRSSIAAAIATLGRLVYREPGPVRGRRPGERRPSRAQPDRGRRLHRAIPASQSADHAGVSWLAVEPETRRQGCRHLSELRLIVIVCRQAQRFH